MEKISSNGINWVRLNGTSPYKARTAIVEIIKTYFTPDVNKTWKITESENTLVQDGGTEETINEQADGYQLLQCPWDNNFYIRIGYLSTNSALYVTFTDTSNGNGENIFTSGDLMNKSMYTCQFKEPLYFNFIVSKSKKSFAFSCYNEIGYPYMEYLCAISEKGKMGVFLIPEINGMGSLNNTALMYNGYLNPFQGGWNSNPFIYKTFPILQQNNTIILPCLADNTGDLFPEVYHLISAPLNTDAEIAKAVFKINNSIYHGIMKGLTYSSYQDNWWRTGPFLLQIE